MEFDIHMDQFRSKEKFRRKKQRCLVVTKDNYAQVRKKGKGLGTGRIIKKWTNIKKYNIVTVTTTNKADWLYA